MHRNRRIIASKPALLIYTVVSREYLKEKEVERYLRTRWEACRNLRMTNPIPELGCQTEFPTDFSSSYPSLQILAACTNSQNRKYQAFLFGYHDTVGAVVCLASDDVVVCLASDDVGETLGSAWQKFYLDWLSHAHNLPLPKGVLGEAYVFHALIDCAVEELHTLCEGVLQPLRSLPVASPHRKPTPYLSEQGFCLCEDPPDNQRRVFYMLCPKAQEDAATAWLLWQGAGQLAPFIRCFIHASKIRYEDRVYIDDKPKLDELRKDIDKNLDELLQQCKHFTADSVLSIQEMIQIQKSVSKLQTQNSGLIMSLSRLKELIVTVEIANRNLQSLLPPAHPRSPQSALVPFHADLEIARWLQRQANYDLRYLEATRERAQEANQLVAVHLEHASQSLRRRQNDLSLLQTSLLGALLAVMSAIEAFQLNLPLPERLHSPLLVFLAALFLFLPPAIMRWHEPYQRIDYVLVAFLGGSIGWLAAAACFLNALWMLLASFVGALSAPLLLWRLDRWQTQRRKQQQAPSRKQQQAPSSAAAGAESPRSSV